LLHRLKEQAQGMEPGGFKLWVKLDSTCTACPTVLSARRSMVTLYRLLYRAVAVQVKNLKKQHLKPVFHHFRGSRIETRRFQAIRLNWIQLVQSPTAPPCRPCTSAWARWFPPA
jgi:hypothetical protein